MRRILIAVAFLATMSSSPALGEEDALKAITAAIEAHEYDRALALAEVLVAEKPSGEEVAEVLFDAGVAAVQKMELASAAGLYRLLLDHYPKIEQASAARAELVACYTHLRQLDLCIAQAEENLKLDPDSQWVEYWEFLIPQSQFRLWNYKEAKTGLEAFLKKYPDGEYAKHARSNLGNINPPWEIDENGLVRYSGKFEKDIRLKAAIESLPADYENGFRMLEDRLGLDLREPMKVLIAYQDAGSETKGGLKASTLVIARNDQPTVMIRFYSEHVVAQPASYRQTITHEMKHAGFQGLMGHSYGDLPQWIREGLAVWGSDDVKTRLQLVLSNQISAGRDPMTVLDGIEDGDRDEADYMEDALAFEWLESKKAGNVKAFCKRLVKGEPYGEIWAELSGMSYEKAMDEANAHCRRRVETTLGDAYPAFAALREAHDKSVKTGKEASQKWLGEGGKADFEKWLAENPGHPAAPFGRFCLARSLLTVGRFDEGRALLKQILDHDNLRCTLLDDAQLWIGVSYNWQQDFDKAGAAFGVLLRDYSSSHAAKQVFGKFPAADPITE